jgi:tight adherence protein B
MKPVVVFGAAVTALLAFDRTVVGSARWHAAHRVRGRLIPRRRTPNRPRRLTSVLEVFTANRHRRAADDGVAGWLDAAARAARSGAILRLALVDAALAVRDEPVRLHLDPFVRELRRDEPIAVALDALVGPTGSPTALVRRALRLATTTGGPAAPMLDAVATTLHERAALAREVRALATQARASAVVMVAAPVAFGMVASGIDPQVGAFARSPVGLACVTAGLALDGVGAWWMRRVVQAVS